MVSLCGGGKGTELVMGKIDILKDIFNIYTYLLCISWRHRAMSRLYNLFKNK